MVGKTQVVGKLHQQLCHGRTAAQVRDGAADPAANGDARSGLRQLMALVPLCVEQTKK